jgi:hypothetical protein
LQWGIGTFTKETVQMFRKFFAAVVALMLVVGGLFADEISAIFKKFDEGKITVEVDGKEMTYKVAKDAMYKGKTDLPVADWAKTKAKVDAKYTLTVEKDVVTSITKAKK